MCHSVWIFTDVAHPHASHTCFTFQMFTELQQMRQQLPDMEFGRRMAVERELEKVDGIRLTNIIFDETGHFVLYGTMLGIKVINVETNRYVKAVQ